MDTIFYVDKVLLDRIRQEFSLTADEGWYQLYQRKVDMCYWRLDKFDKLQVQFFVKLPTKENWQEFDDKELRIQLLRKTRGTTNIICKWQGCTRNALQDLVFCDIHAYDMGIRK